jgi:TnpA family transposase
MPRRSLLSNEQRTRLFAVPVDHAEMAKHYVLSADDMALVWAKRRTVNRLGFAVQLCLLRYPGLGMGPAEQLPEAMIAFVARQLGVRRVDFAN